MKDESILNQIMSKNRLEDWLSLNSAVIIEELFKELNEREKEVLTRRFGLRSSKRETLEKIGKERNLTRERIRQIESGGLNRVKKNSEMENIIAKLKQAVSLILEEHGGLMAREHLFEILTKLSAEQSLERSVFENHLDFLLAKILDKDIAKISSPHFNTSFRLRFMDLQHLESLAKELLEKINEGKKLLAEEELMSALKDSSIYQEQKEKFNAPNNIDLSRWLPEDNADDRILKTFLRALVNVEKNRFGFWGHTSWREIKPKTINDKIYLILKNHGEPLYYGDIAKKITEMGFDKKNVNTATTHNELILDDKYILVGRGLYGLKEWGYKDGTVADVVAGILKEAGGVISKQEIVEKVLAQRQVKATTINLALMDRKRFEKLPGGKYQLK